MNKTSQWHFYFLLIIFGIMINTIIESFVIRLGFVFYNVTPTFLGIWWFTFVIYVPWVALTYKLGNLMSRKFKINKLFFYFLVGALFAFSIDQYATSIGLYGYSWDSVFYIFKVPIEDFFAVGTMITISVAISEHAARFLLKAS